MNLVVFYFCFFAIVLGKNGPAVILPEYTANGVDYTTPGGNKANAFFGLPYAEPPIGELRHEKPVSLMESDRTIDATQFGPPCLVPLDVPDQSEDCLFINVFAPKEAPSGSGYHVLIFIHGGGYSYGNAKIYGIDEFVDSFVKQNIIVVTLQYRLHWFGFLTTFDDVLPGNVGLWDQNLALKFIHQNIRHFGGDPNEMTLMGHSAGSSSVHAHSISPHSRNLIKQFVPLSGSLFGSWALENPNQQKFQTIFHEKLGCFQKNSAEFKKCAKNVNSSLVLEISKQLPSMAFDAAFLHFTPVLDQEFFDGKTIDKLTEEAAPKPVLYGITGAEAMILTFSHPNLNTAIFADNYGIKKDEMSMTNAERIDYMKISEKMEPGNTVFNRPVLLWRTMIEILGYKHNFANGDQLYH
uniref:Carboxylic ester hydrolase n=1 Tax=Panagrolaimus sp. JU765 TaxID=591449 RepID=A0AC34RD49_9BILA